LKVLIVDDHQLIREGIKRTLLDSPSITGIGEAGDGQEALDILRQSKWDIVILDIKLPGRSGLDVLQDIKQEFPRLPVLMLSMYPERQFAVRVLKTGASGYLTKASAARELLDAVYKISAGGRYISAEVAEEIVAILQHEKTRSSHHILTNREYQAFMLFAAGAKARDIAKEMNLSIKTVNTYRANIFEKLSLENVGELIEYAIDHGLIERTSK
jgi:two-component system, NarL family, invasion response regulator UvrY